ncbi:hypothetical protein HQ447_07725 [bacterium]|nr:hypothetical protein [bacterium]
MITSIIKSLLLGGAGLTGATLLSNCVDPYGPAYGSQQRVTTYHAGYEVRSLPPGYRSETIGGTRFYSHNGTYYQPRSGRYVVVEAPRHYSDRNYSDRNYSGRPNPYRDRQIITELPRGYREVNYRGNRYYHSNDVYYQHRGSGYVTVTRPY